MRERGFSVSVEAAIILPALLLFLGLLVTLARIALAQQDIGAAAALAAREATLVHVGRAGVAETAARQGLTERAVPCDSPQVSVAAVTAAIETVTVRISCRVKLADLSLPFVPGYFDVAAERSSPVDPYR